MGSIAGKAAIVTGSTRGIGLAIARMLLERGASVFVSARTKEAVERTIDELRRATKADSQTVAGAACDVRRYADVRAMIQEAVQALGGIDILINNAGIGLFSNVATMPVEDWEATIQTNLSGVFYCSRESIPEIRQRGGGAIINIGSLAGRNAFAGGAAYNASKFGLIGFSEALMQEVRYDHIRVSCVMPGSVNTEFSRAGVQDPTRTWKLWPEDVAQVVCDILEMDPRALPSLVELRPSEPKK